VLYLCIKTQIRKTVISSQWVINKAVQAARDNRNRAQNAGKDNFGQLMGIDNCSIVKMNME